MTWVLRIWRNWIEQSIIRRRRKCGIYTCGLPMRKRWRCDNDDFWMIVWQECSLFLHHTRDWRQAAYLLSRWTRWKSKANATVSENSLWKRTVTGGGGKNLKSRGDGQDLTPRPGNASEICSGFWTGSSRQRYQVILSFQLRRLWRDIWRISPYSSVPSCCRSVFFTRNSSPVLKRPDWRKPKSDTAAFTA